eukprot:6190387-Pleurochrysis_carterae.AAC.3
MPSRQSRQRGARTSRGKRQGSRLPGPHCAAAAGRYPSHEIASRLLLVPRGDVARGKLSAAVHMP